MEIQKPFKLLAFKLQHNIVIEILELQITIWFGGLGYWLLGLVRDIFEMNIKKPLISGFKKNTMIKSNFYLPFIYE